MKLFQEFVDYEKAAGAPLSLRQKPRGKKTITVALHPHSLYLVEPTPPVQGNTDSITTLYELPNFKRDLETYLKSLIPTDSPLTYTLPTKVDVWQRIRFTNPNTQFDTAADHESTAVAAPPRMTAKRRKDENAEPLPARYDSILVHNFDRSLNRENAFGVKCESFQRSRCLQFVLTLFSVFKIGILKVIFELPPSTLPTSLPAPGILAYVEWLRVADAPHEPSGMYAVHRPSRAYESHEVISASLIHSSCHLIPDFGNRFNRTVDSITALQTERVFWLNNYYNAEAFQKLY